MSTPFLGDAGSTSPLSQLQSPLFSAEIYAQRVQRVRDECVRRDLDGVLLFAQESLYYLFGYDQLGYWVFQTVFLPLVGQPFSVCRAPDELLIKACPMLKDEVIVWDDEGQSGTTMTADRLNRHSSSDIRIGIELESHALLGRYYLELSGQLEAHVSLVDASNLVSAHRSVKSDIEIPLVRRAADTYRASMSAVRSAVVEGKTELDVYSCAVAQLANNGGDPPAIPPPIASGFRTLGQTHLPPSERRISPGEPLVVEIGASSRRYHAVGARSFCLGHASSEAEQLHEAMVLALEAGFDAIRPGKPASGVASVVQRTLQLAGYSRAGRHVGYSTGIAFPPTWVERLKLKTTAEYSLVSGMVFFYFIGVVAPSGSFGLYIGEPILVAESGAIRLSQFDYRDWIIG